MNKTEQAQQFRLAAEIIETGHPWKSSPQAPDTDIYSALRDGFEIRLILATPPDNRPLHNPDNLTAEQVGAGYRLLTQDEFHGDAHTEYQEWWSVSAAPNTWIKDKKGGSRGPTINYGTTYRLPLSVPWPELPKQEPEFTIPPPPPGMQWHRTDGWKAEDLPPGTRPLFEGENVGVSDQCLLVGTKKWTRSVNQSIGMAVNCLYRTTRPLVFTHEGKEWTWHRPGDPMPCDKSRKINAMMISAIVMEDCDPTLVRWSKMDLCDDSQAPGDIIGWRYAEPETKEVGLGPEDVPPGSVFRHIEFKPGVHLIPSLIQFNGLCWIRKNIITKKYTTKFMPFHHLRESWQINRSLPLTGKWNPDAWEPCHKQI